MAPQAAGLQNLLKRNIDIFGHWPGFYFLAQLFQLPYKSCCRKCLNILFFPRNHLRNTLLHAMTIRVIP